MARWIRRFAIFALVFGALTVTVSVGDDSMDNADTGLTDEQVAGLNDAIAGMSPDQQAIAVPIISQSLNDLAAKNAAIEADPVGYGLGVIGQDASNAVKNALPSGGTLFGGAAILIVILILVLLILGKAGALGL